MAEQANKPTPAADPPLVQIFTTFLRAATRPVVTVIFAGVIAQVVVQGIDPPQWFLILATSCIAWWFGDRTLQHIQENKQQK